MNTMIRLSTITRHIFILSLIFCLSGTSSNIQAQSSSLLNRANAAYENYNYTVAAEYYENYLENNTSGENKTVLANLADCYWQSRLYEEAFRVYRLLYPDNNKTTEATEKDKIRIAELYARFGQYEEAAEWLNGLANHREKARVYANLKERENLKKDSLKWQLAFPDINTSYREFSPFLLDTTSLLFSSNKPLNIRKKASGWDGNSFARMWKVPVSEINLTPIEKLQENAYKSDSQNRNKIKRLADIYENSDNKPYSAARRIKDLRYTQSGISTKASLVDGLNKTAYNAGTIAIDDNSRIYFSANYKKTAKDGINRLYLLEGTYTGEGIKDIKALPFGDAQTYSVTHPAVNAAGTILVFASAENADENNYDLYYSRRSGSGGDWSVPVAFGKNINTAGNEVFPSVTRDGYLYFSSDLLPGLGGLDIFRIPLQDAFDGKGTPEHLSYPINSSSDDFGFTQYTSGQKGFFTSDRLNSGDDLYSFRYNTKTGETFIEGYVLDKQTGEALANVTVLMWDKQSDKVYVAKTDQTGKYVFTATGLTDIAVKAVEKNYQPDCLIMKLQVQESGDDIHVATNRKLYLGKYEVGDIIKIQNIHYDFDKWNIRADAKPILDSLIQVLNAYPIEVELGSHTDSRGSYAYNERLAQRRANAAVTYLVERGISPERITAKGYGESQLLNKCADGVPCSKEEHQANRRTEVKITAYIAPETSETSVVPAGVKSGDVINKSDLPADFFDDCK